MDDIELSRRYSMGKTYGLSKLYVIWVMRHFVSEMKRSGIANITFNTVHPGSAATNLARESSKLWKFRIIMFLWIPMLTTVAKGASSSIKAAAAPELEGVTGKYFGTKGEEKPSDKYYSPENEQAVWEYCRKAVS